MRHRGRVGQVCKEDGCTAPLDVYQCRGYCLKHYRVHRLAGEFGYRGCSVDGCDRHAVGAGLCELHRNRNQRLGRLDLDPAPKVGSRAASWRGGRKLTGSGYVAVTLPPDHPEFGWARVPTLSSGSVSRTILEHRLVMGQALGRPLARHETVHHINGIRTDNRLENLQLRVGAHGVGVRLQCSQCGSHDLQAVEL